jgi:hypothetical protein
MEDYNKHGRCCQRSQRGGHVLATIAQKQRFNLGCERGSELVNLVDSSCLDFDISSPPRDYIAMSSRRSELNEAICFCADAKQSARVVDSGHIAVRSEKFN